MPTIELIDRGGCPLCSSCEIKEHIPFQDIPVVRCQKRGFLYSSKLMSDDSLNAYYADNFGSQRHLQGQIVNAKVNHWALGKLLDLDSIRNILDVGTGYGFLLKELGDKNSIKACGVELSRQEAAYGKDNLALDIHDVLLSESGIEINSFDAVTSFEVIKHIPEPVNF